MKRLAVYSTMFTLSITSLLGCSLKDKDQGVIEYGNFGELNGDIKEGDKKEFFPYEHFFSIHLETFEDAKKYLYNESFMISSNTVPEEYEMLIVQGVSPLQEPDGQQEYELCFINKVSVEVTASYNEKTATYDYNHFGNAIEKTENDTPYVLHNMK